MFHYVYTLTQLYSKYTLCHRKACTVGYGVHLKWEICSIWIFDNLDLRPLHAITLRHRDAVTLRVNNNMIETGIYRYK